MIPSTGRNRVTSSWLCGSAFFLHFLLKAFLFQRLLRLLLHVLLCLMTLGHSSSFPANPIFDYVLASFYRRFPPMPYLFLFRLGGANAPGRRNAQAEGPLKEGELERPADWAGEILAKL